MTTRVIAHARATPNRSESSDSTGQHLRSIRHVPDAPQYADLSKEYVESVAISRLLWRPCSCLLLAVL